MTPGEWLLLVLGLGTGCGYACWVWYQERRRRERLASRAAPDFDEWMLRYWRAAGYDRALVREVLEALSAAVGTDATRFRPTDDLQRDLVYGPRALLVDHPLGDFYDRVHQIVRARTGVCWMPDRRTVRTLEDVLKSVADTVSESRAR